MNQLVQIGRIKHLLDKKTLLLLINSFVFSESFYCSSVWGNTSKRNLQIQNCRWHTFLLIEFY